MGYSSYGLLKEWQEHATPMLEPILAPLTRKDQVKKTTGYLHGLITLDNGRNIERISKKSQTGSYEGLQNHISNSRINHEQMHVAMVEQVFERLGKGRITAIIDDTPLKAGPQQVGAARQYSGARGKTDLCQSVVTITLCNEMGVSYVVAMHLFLPKKEWISQPKRMDKAGVPKKWQRYKTKPEIALYWIDWILDLGGKIDVVLGDAGYGKSKFRKALVKRGLPWVVGIPKDVKVYPVDVVLKSPDSAEGKMGRRRKTPYPDRAPASVEQTLSDAEWNRVVWREGTKGPMSARFAGISVRVASGKVVSVPGEGTHGLPADEYRLIGEHRDEDSVLKYYFSNLPADFCWEKLVFDLKNRWPCETAHQQMKQYFGLEDFQARGWIGLHRHMLFVMIAHNLTQALRVELYGCYDYDIDQNVEELGEGGTEGIVMPANAMSTPPNAGSKSREAKAASVRDSIGRGADTSLKTGQNTKYSDETVGGTNNTAAVKFNCQTTNPSTEQPSTVANYPAEEDSVDSRSSKPTGDSKDERSNVVSSRMFKPDPARMPNLCLALKEEFRYRKVPGGFEQKMPTLPGLRKVISEVLNEMRVLVKYGFYPVENRDLKAFAPA